MFCKHCGYVVSEHAAFCQNCGGALKPAQPDRPFDDAPLENPYTQSDPNPYVQNPYTPPETNPNISPHPAEPQPTPEPAYPSGQPYGFPQPDYAPPYSAPFADPDGDAGDILTFGILGAVFSLLVSIVGVIFSAMALSRAKRYRSVYGELRGKANAGYILGVIGLILSIIFVTAVAIILFWIFAFTVMLF